MGIAFELIQHDMYQMKERPSINPLEIDKIYDQIKLYRNIPIELEVRADLMMLQLYHWTGRPKEMLELGELLFAKYDPLQFRQEIATMHMFIAKNQYFKKNYAVAFNHAVKTINLYPDSEPIWPGMDHLEVTYEILLRSAEKLGDEESRSKYYILFEQHLSHTEIFQNYKRHYDMVLNIKEHMAVTE